MSIGEVEIRGHMNGFDQGGQAVDRAREQAQQQEVRNLAHDTLHAYWEANIELTRVVPDLNLYDLDWPIWTYQDQMPPAKFVFDDDGRRGMAVDSLVSGGCIISGSEVRRSVLFSNVHVQNYCEIEDCVILPNVEIGNNVTLRRVVVDQHCRLPSGLTAGVDPAADRKRFHVTDRGVTIIVPESLGQRVHHLR
jgi:glucose-1-phosphate adenylyltransferase